MICDRVSFSVKKVTGNKRKEKGKEGQGRPSTEVETGSTGRRVPRRVWVGALKKLAG